MTLTPRRFYKKADVRQTDDGFGLALDGKPVKTPAGTVLVVPTQPLAQALADEWEAQKDKIDPLTMPLTRLVSTAIDRVRAGRVAVISGIAAYAGTDLLSYRAESPPDLVARQDAAWERLLDWAEKRIGHRLLVTRGVVPVSQPATALQAYERVLADLHDLDLAAVALATQTAGSLVIGLALHAGELDAEGAFDAAELDATFQIERWGEDEEARDHRARVLADFRTAARLIELSKPKGRAKKAP